MQPTAGKLSADDSL